jgi:hypothetical protein
MQPTELLGRSLASVKARLGGEHLLIVTSGISSESGPADEHSLRVARVRETAAGLELTVVLPPKLDFSL